MPVCHAWTWIAGESPDGAPIIERRLAAGAHDARPADAPESAWLAEQDADAWREEIMARLSAIDAKSIRALREGNAARLAALEAEAEALRGVLRSLPGG